MTEWTKGNEKETRSADGDLGGTMRLGAYPATLKPGSRVAEVYGATTISERHRHRYEVNVHYTKELAAHGHGGVGLVAGRKITGDHGNPRSSLVHRRAIPSRTEITAAGATSTVHQLHRRGGAEEPPGLDALLSATASGSSSAGATRRGPPDGVICGWGCCSCCAWSWVRLLFVVLAWFWMV